MKYSPRRSSSQRKSKILRVLTPFPILLSSPAPQFSLPCVRSSQMSNWNWTLPQRLFLIHFWPDLTPLSFVTKYACTFACPHASLLSSFSMPPPIFHFFTLQHTKTRPNILNTTSSSSLLPFHISLLNKTTLKLLLLLCTYKSIDSKATSTCRSHPIYIYMW